MNTASLSPKALDVASAQTKKSTTSTQTSTITGCLTCASFPRVNTPLNITKRSEISERKCAACGNNCGKPSLLDLFCGAGGAARGYQQAGFCVLGVDVKSQPRYIGCQFYQADAMTFPLEGFDAIHASPPCQGYSVMRHLPWNRDREYPMLIADVRQRLGVVSVPWVIENVEGARRHMQAGWLCGTMFSLPFYRHRLFETNFFWLQPGHPRHEWRIRGGHTLAGRARQVGFTERYTKAGRPQFGFDKVGSAIGHGAGAVLAREAMGVDWMSRDESTQAIPPAYTEYIGKQLLAALGGVA